MNRPQLTHEQRVICDQSLSCVHALDALSRSNDFQFFMDRIRRRADQLADEVLHKEDITPDEREKLRNHRSGIMEVLAIPRDDRDASVRILAQYGLAPGAAVDDDN
jgi:hypothetical protein